MLLDRAIAKIAAAGIGVSGIVGSAEGVGVSSVTSDSRAVQPGALFCCIPGAVTDGHRFASDAVRAGAVALLCERELPVPVPQVVVPPGNARRAMAQVAAEVYGRPAERLAVAGVTGTNGKTSVTLLVRSMMEAAGIPTRSMGTLDGPRTTPEAPVIQERLARWADEGARAAVLEVSSHAMTQHRVDGIVFACVAFTNLSHDHLDYHGDMEAYFEAKASLFTPARARSAVVAVDDRWGLALADRLDASGELPVTRVRMDDATEVRVDLGATIYRWRDLEVRLRTTGAFGVRNALVASAVAMTLGATPEAVVAGLAAAPPVPGRMEVVPGGDRQVLVDFAHTPAALEVVLETARQLAGGGRVWCVFGCGGDRDRAKRRPMGAVVARLADVAVVTSDNPRTEDPDAIIAEVVAGTAEATVGPGGRRAHVVVQPDRAAAITMAVAEARPGDVVVVAGKGHETSQVVGDRRIEFDDRQVARAALAAVSRQGVGGEAR